MSHLNITPSQETFSELDAFIEPPLSGSEHEPPVLEEHGVQLDSAQFYIIAQPLNQFLRSYVFTGQTDQRHDGISIHTDSLFCIPAKDLIQFLESDAYYTEQHSFAGENGTPLYSASWLIPAAELYQFLERHVHPASELPSPDNGHEIPTEPNDMLVDAPLSLLIPARSLTQFLHRYEIPPVQSSFDSGHETPEENDPMSRSVTPTQSQDSDDQVDAEPDEAPTSFPHVCPFCETSFKRMQERNRHVETHLPHSILCSFQGCTWTGRRQWDFEKQHWGKKHAQARPALVGDAKEIYDPKDFVKMIVDRTPVDEVARYAFAKVRESLGQMGRPDVLPNVLGRNRDLKKWIRQLN